MEALAVIIPIAIVAGTIFVIMKVARQASEQYGFGMIRNWTFALVLLSLISGFSGWVVSFDPQGQASSLIFVAVWLGLGGWAAYINVQRSTPKFGIMFTVLQYVATIGVIAPIILFFTHQRSMNVMRNMG